MHKDLLIVQVVFQTFCIYSQGKYFGWGFFLTNISLSGQGQCPSSFPAPMLTSEFHFEPEGTPATLISLALAMKSQHQTALPASKAIAQTEPEGNKTEPVEKLLKSNSFGQYERNSKFTSSGKDIDCTK